MSVRFDIAGEPTDIFHVCYSTYTECEKNIRLVNHVKITIDYRTHNSYPTTIYTNTIIRGSHAHITSHNVYLT